MSITYDKSCVPASSYYMVHAAKGATLDPADVIKCKPRLCYNPPNGHPHHCSAASSKAQPCGCSSALERWCESTSRKPGSMSLLNASSVFRSRGFAWRRSSGSGKASKGVCEEAAMAGV